MLLTLHTLQLFVDCSHLTLLSLNFVWTAPHLKGIFLVEGGFFGAGEFYWSWGFFGVRGIFWGAGEFLGARDFCAIAGLPR